MLETMTAVEFELTTLVVIYTDCTGRCTIGTTTSPIAAKKIKDMLPCDERKTT
jgi:hypothetical protein